MYVIYVSTYYNSPMVIRIPRCHCRLCIGPWPKEYMYPSECVWMVPGTVDPMED